MKTNRPFSHRSCGFTLLEMTTVIVILLIFLKIGLYSSTKIDQWKLGRNASETLRSVYAAQRMYLSDYPTTPVANLTHALVLPYLPPGNVATMPTVKSLSGANLNILVNVSPPIIDSGNGTAYDPSDKTTDSLWDIGQ